MSCRRLQAGRPSSTLIDGAIMTHTNQVHAEATVECERADAHTSACEQAQNLGATMRPLKEHELQAIAGGPIIINTD
jgi:hypothetical protein